MVNGYSWFSTTKPKGTNEMNGSNSLIHWSCRFVFHEHRHVIGIVSRYVDGIYIWQQLGQHGINIITITNPHSGLWHNGMETTFLQNFDIESKSCISPVLWQMGEVAVTLWYVTVMTKAQMLFKPTMCPGSYETTCFRRQLSKKDFKTKRCWSLGREFHSLSSSQAPY